MAFGISQSVRSREVQVCTPELFHQATKSSRVKDVCAQIEDALERKRRGEIVYIVSVNLFVKINWSANAGER